MFFMYWSHSDIYYSFPFFSSWISVEPFLHLRYEGTDCALMVSADGYEAMTETSKHGDFKKAFTER